MTREIIFRGKRVDNGEWVYGGLIHRPSFQAENDSEYAAIIVMDKGHDSHYNAYLELEVDPSTVGQFSGLLDKDGNKIFEGDVLLIGSNELGFMTNGKGHPARYIVKHEGCDYVLFRPDTNLIWGRLSRIEELCWGCETIDNIHDNPELLNP